MDRYHSELQEILAKDSWCFADVYRLAQMVEELQEHNHYVSQDLRKALEQLHRYHERLEWYRKVTVNPV